MHRSGLALLVPLFLFPLGCAPHAGVDARADSALEDLRSRTDAGLVMARCEGGRVVGPNCGFLFRSLAQPEVQERFRAQHCRNMPEADCQARYERFTNAQLVSRYFAADWEAVQLACDRSPSDCDTNEGFELVLMRDHNARLTAEARSEEAAIEMSRRRGHAASIDAQGQTATAIAATVIATVARGNRCWSYPNVFGGTTSICEE